MRVELGEERWLEALEAFQGAWSRITAAPYQYGDCTLQATRWERREPKAKLLSKPRASLVMERVPLTASRSEEESERGREEVEEEEAHRAKLWEATDEETDDDCLSLAELAPQHYYDFHILYNSSFRVPELFLLGYRADGSVLSLDEVLGDFSSKGATAYSKEALSSVFLEKEHPLLLLPWVGTHLCETSGLVSQMLLLPEADGVEGEVSPTTFDALKYMLSWWSSVGKYVGLHLPLERVKTAISVL